MNEREPIDAERRLDELGIVLPAPPAPLGMYTEAVLTGCLLFLTGMLPIEDGQATHVGPVTSDDDLDDARAAARRAALNGIALVRHQLGSLNRVSRIVRLGVYIATSVGVRAHPAIADGASELLQDVFGRERNPCRMVIGVASLPLGVPVELELVFEVVE